MKKYIFLILFLLLTGFFSCGKMCGCIIPPPEPNFRGVLNKTLWEPALADTIKNDSISVWGKRSTDELKLKFKINPSSTETSALVGNYDVTYEILPRTERGQTIYTLDKSSASNRVILSYSQAQNFLMGQVNLTLKLATPTGNIAIDTARIYVTNAGFMVRLRK